MRQTNDIGEHVLHQFDEWANKSAVAHAAVQMKAASLARQLLEVIPDFAKQFVLFHRAQWVETKRGTQLQWANPTVACRFGHRPEDWDDNVRRLRQQLSEAYGLPSASYRRKRFSYR